MSPLRALLEALLSGGAVFYIWMLVSQLNTPGLRTIQRWLRLSWRRPLTSCPYCFGFWASVLVVLAMQFGHLDPILTPLTVLASAALAGFVGSLTPGMDAEEDILDE